MLLSIITINLNNANGLKTTVESVVHQSFQEFEYIVIDGGSNDESVEIISQYKERVNYWASEKDKGIYNAMNKGLVQATGGYLMFLNSGDALYDHDTLQKIIPFLNNADIIYGDFVIVYPGGSEELVKNNKDISYLSFLGRERHFCHQAVFMSRVSIDKAGGKFDESLKLLADWKMLSIAIIKQEASRKYVNEIVCNYEGSGLTMQPSSSSLVQNEYNRVLQDEFPLFYKDVERLRQMGATFPELFNSKYFKAFLQFKKRIKGLFLKFKLFL